MKADVLFFDRKNGYLVRASELVQSNLHRNRVGATTDQPDPKVQANINDLFVHDEIIGTLCYKSDKCPKYMNHDMWLNDSDLVFLRVEFK